jgi:large subunit ribosomal protein L9
MQVILLEKVVNVGNLGDVVKVKDGYARNFLIPQKMARRATASAVAEFEVKRAELEKAAAEKLGAAQGQGEKLNGMTITIAQKAGVDGRLFGSVTNFDIAEALSKQGFAVEKAQVRLPTGPLKTTGEHPVAVALHTDVVVDVTIAVVGEAAKPSSPRRRDPRFARVVVAGRNVVQKKPGFARLFFAFQISPIISAADGEQV